MGRTPEGLRERGLSVLGVNFDPEMVARWRARGLPTHYGDASDPDFGKSLSLATASWVVCAIPVHGGSLTHDDPRLGLIDALRNHGYRQCIAVAIHQPDDLPALRSRDVDLVLLPMADAAAEAGGPDYRSADGSGPRRARRRPKRRCREH